MYDVVMIVLMLLTMPAFILVLTAPPAWQG